MHRAPPTTLVPEFVVPRSGGLARAPQTAPAAHARLVAVLLLVIVVLTGLGVLVGVLAPSLAPGGTPHPTLHGTLAEAANILVHNARILMAPLILAAAGWGRGPATRVTGDAIVAATLIVNPLIVGSAMGRHGDALIAYLPHLPLEWAALGVAAGAWLTGRRAGAPARTLAAYAAVALLLAAAAALIETFASPHLA